MERVANAEPTERRPTLGEGRYFLQIEAIKMFDSKKNATTWFLSEFEVLDSDQDTVPPGSKRVWLQDMTQDSSYTNVKNFFGAILPAATEEQLKNPDMLLQLVSPKNPAAGERVRLEVSMQDSQSNPGRQYRYYAWEPADPNADAAVA